MKQKFETIALGFDILVEAVTETQKTIRQSISDSILAGGKIESIQSEYGYDFKKLELLLAKIKEAEGILRGNYSSDTKSQKEAKKKDLKLVEFVVKNEAIAEKAKESFWFSCRDVVRKNIYADSQKAKINLSKLVTRGLFIKVKKTNAMGRSIEQYRVKDLKEARLVLRGLKEETAD